MVSGNKLAGPGYIILNILRVANIISLFMLFIASWIILVMTVKTNQFFFFDGVSHFIVSIISFFLIISELMLFEEYFVKHWPLLSSKSGLFFLGLVMIILGFETLGNLNKGATSAQNLGLPMWRTVISSGVLTSLLGLFNIIATYIFCQSEQGVTGRQIRSDGAAAVANSSSDPLGEFSFPYSPEDGRVSPLPRYSTRNKSPSFPFRFPFFTRRSSHIKPTKKPEISSPTPLRDPEKFGHLEDRSSPIVPGLIRPPTALHPAYNPDRTVNAPFFRYSQASKITSF